MEERNCFGCNKLLSEPYLCCAECLPPLCYICLNCYSQGKEFGLHENSHPYKIIRNNFSILDPEWSSAEEIKLLDGISKSGFGNWVATSHFVGSKTKEQCKEHYLKHYINSPREELPNFNVMNSLTEVKATPIPIKFSENPPRPLSSYTSRDLADYMPGRGDFGFDYDNFAELDMKNSEFHSEADDLENELQLAVANIYNLKLKERARRKWIMKEHGLINPRSNFLFSLRYCKIMPKLFEKLVRFAHFLSGDSFMYFLESKIVEIQLKQKIQQLQEYRKAGITCHDSVPTYLYSKQKRQEFLITKNVMFSELLSHASDEASLILWLKKKKAKENSKNFNRALVKNPRQQLRKAAPPLEITGLPGFDQLSPKEKVLCSLLRLLPRLFLQIKATLINASDKVGGLKLAQARSIVKIDVNKTRKIYDLLVEDGFVKSR